MDYLQEAQALDSDALQASARMAVPAAIPDHRECGCGEDIPRARLMAMPSTRECVSCAERTERLRMRGIR